MFVIEQRQLGLPVLEICQKIYGNSNEEELTQQLLLTQKTAHHIN
jgi:hypothetical protein